MNENHFSSPIKLLAVSADKICYPRQHLKVAQFRGKNVDLATLSDTSTGAMMFRKFHCSVQNLFALEV